MGEWIELEARDGTRLSAWRAEPVQPKGRGLVILQEIFGVNDHIRGVCERWAGYGYSVLAPALFDRVQPGVELGYQPADVERGRELKGRVAPDQALLDVEAAVEALAAEAPVATLGFCWGGLLAWLSATRLGDRLACSVAYYGGGIAASASERPLCPVLFHFGEQDQAIPLADVETVRAAQPQAPLHLYPAGHGFACEARGAYHAESAALAEERSLAFLKQHLG